MTPRDYQIQAIEDAHDKVLAGHRRILIHSGTGTGKTVIAAEITKRAVALGHHVLFLAHRKELIDQAYAKLATFGVDASVVMADDPRHAPWKLVCVASVQTLARREYKPKATLIFVDEAHRAPADSYLAILAAYPKAIVIGLTATPVRADGRGLGTLFDVMVSCPSVAQMMERLDPVTGKPYLISTRVFGPSAPDLSEIKVVHGDYSPDDLAQACDKPKLVGDIVATWLRLADRVRTVVFAAGIEHSQHITAAFVAAGVKAEHLDGTTPKEERAAILKRLETGETTVLSNVGVLTEGWDMPCVACVVLARPTKSMGLYLQMVGRILRPYPGKRYALILDHAGATHAHGFVDDEREWPLTMDKAKPKGSFPVQTCKMCFATFRPGPAICPFCGSPVERKSRELEQVDGDLVELQRRSAGAQVAQLYRDIIANRNLMAQRTELDTMLRDCKQHGYRPGVARDRFATLYGAPPPRAWMPRAWQEAHPE